MPSDPAVWVDKALRYSRSQTDAPDMLDDEIVFLGARHAQTSPPAQRPVTGVVLHVEKSGGIDGYGMLFRRVNTMVVHIGRRSGLETDRRSQDNDCAMFRCAVVSRKHAKIAFSDSGHAYLIDLGSHHGTHIRKSGEKFSKMLKPETSTLLADGDIVTFGKSVGKGDECVRPVVARIELLYSGHKQPASVFKPLVVPSTSSPSSSERSVAKSSSGRYGINTSRSSSSDESYSNSHGVYSDIEEVPAPSSSSKLVVESQSKPSTNVTGSFGHAFNAINVLKRLLPPSHQPSTPRRLPSVSEIVERPLAQMSSLFGVLGPESVPASPRYSPILPLPELGRALSPPFSTLDFLPVGFDASQHDIYEVSDEVSNKSRSNSPMDLASPSPAPKVVVSRPLSIPPAPIQLPRLSTPPPPVGLKMVDLAPINSPAGSSSDSKSSEADDGEAQRVMPDVASPEEQASSSSPSANSAEPVASASAPVVSLTQMKDVEDTLRRLEADVAKLHNHRRKYKSRFNVNAQVISQKLDEFYDRFAEVNAEYTILFDQVDTIQHVDIPDMQAHLESLQERVDDFPSPFSTPEPQLRERTPVPSLMEREDVKTSIQALHALVDQMKLFGETTQKQVADELEAIKAMRETALASIAQVQAQAQAQVQAAIQTPVLTSLKRKRDDTDENEEVVESENESVTVNENERTDANAKAEDVVMDEGAPSTPTATLALDVAAARKATDTDGPPPRKRAKRFVSLVAQTATAVTIGAVVTWSALAFS